MATIKGLTLEIGGDTTLLTKALGDVNKTSRELKSELKDIDRLLKLDPGNSDLVAQKQRALAEAVENTAKKLETLKDAQAQAAEQFAKGEIGEDQYRAVQREVIRTEEELRKLNKRLAEANLNWETAAKKIGDFGKKATEIGKNLSMKVTAPIVAIGTAATKMASDFTDAMAKVSTLADENVVSMKDLEKGIKDISNATGIASSEIASSVYDALSAGVDTADVLDFVQSNVMLTKAGFTDMATAIDATSTVLNAYGEAAFDVTKIGDILVKTQDEGKISVDELGKNMGRVIPVASALGVNLDQLGASYSILTAKGQNASIATTNLNSMLGELGKTGSKSDQALRSITGQSFAELVASGKTVGDVLGVLDQHAKGAGLSLSDMFGSTTAGSAALTLLSDGVGAFNDKVDVMNNSSGTMAENFEKLQTPSEKMAISLNKLKNVLIELGTVMLPVIEKLAEWLGKVADKLLGMSDGAKTAIVVVAGLAAAIGPLLIFVGKVASGISALMSLGTTLAPLLLTLKASLAGLAAAVGSVLVPLLPLIPIIAAVVGAGVLLYKNWDSIKELAQDLGKNIGEAWGGLKEATAEAWSGMKESVGSAWEGIKETATSKLDNIKSGIAASIEGIKTGWVATWDSLNELTGGSMDGLKDTLSGTWESIKDAAGHYWELIKNAALAPVLVMADIISGDFDKLGSDLVGIWDNIKEAASGLFESVRGAWDGIKQATDTLKDGVSAAFGGLKDNVVARGTQLKDGIIDAFVKLRDGATERLGQMLTYMQELPQKLLALGQEMMKAIVSGVSEGVSKLVTTFQDIVRNIYDTVKKLPEAMIDIGRNIISGLIKGITSKITALWDTVRNLARGVSDGIRKALKIQSPSKVTEELGSMTGEGFIDGLEEAFKQIKQKTLSIKDMLQSGLSGLEVSMPGVGEMAIAGGGPLNIHIDNFTNNTDKDIEQLAYELEFYRQKAAYGRGRS